MTHEQLTDRELAQAALNEAADLIRCGSPAHAAAWAQIAQAHAILALEAVFGVDLSEGSAA